MAVQLPPWLQIDPIAPARIKLQANAQRNAAAAAERNAQLQQQRLEVEQQMQANAIAAQERAGARRSEVMRQTHDAELAQQAQQNQLRREHQAMQARQFEQNLRMRQQKAEQEASEAAIQMEGSRGLEKDLQAGVPLEQAFPKHAAKLLYKHPERIGSAIKGVTPPGAPQPGWTPSGQEYMTNPNTGAVHFPPRLAAQAGTGPITARQVLDEQGQPLGMRAIPGAGGGIHMLPRTELSPEGRVRALTARMFAIKSMLRDKDETSAEGKTLIKQRDSILSELERLTSPPKSPGKIDESTPPDEEEATPEEETPAPEASDTGEEDTEEE
jgi:hypothetical protein